MTLNARADLTRFELERMLDDGLITSKDVKDCCVDPSCSTGSYLKKVVSSNLFLIPLFSCAVLSTL